MGVHQSHNKKTFNVSQIQHLCVAVKIQLQEYKQTCQLSISEKELEFFKSIRTQSDENSLIAKRNVANESSLLLEIIAFESAIVAAEAIIRKAEAIKDYAQVICVSHGSMKTVVDFLPIIENICWSNALFEVNSIDVFEREFVQFFGGKLAERIENITCVDERVRKALTENSVTPFEELNACANRIAQKFNVSIQEINAGENMTAAHAFYPLKNSSNARKEISDMTVYSTRDKSETIRLRNQTATTMSLHFEQNKQSFNEANKSLTEISEEESKESETRSSSSSLKYKKKQVLRNDLRDDWRLHRSWKRIMLCSS